MQALLDTNILIDYLNGVEAAREEIARYEKPLISPISWMEVMAGVSDEDEQPVRAFLQGFTQVPIDANVAERAVGIRKSASIRLPDAIIRASAQSRGALLVSRNTRDFPPSDPGVRMPYRL